MTLVIALVACGQNTEQDTNSRINDKNTVEDHSKSATSDSDKNQPDKENDTVNHSDTNRSPDKKLNKLSVHYIDVGQADATFFHYTNQDKSYNILFDTGDWQGNEVVNYLSTQGVSYIDLIIVSHPDADHIGQLADVVNAYDVGEVWMSGNESTSEVFQRGMEAVLASGADYDEPRTGDDFEIGPMDIKILHPSSISGKTNEESLSALFTYGNVKFLFTGDTDRNGEKEIMNSGINIDANILQLGHHGSITSSTPAFIDAVSPDVSIYSAGVDNPYGHPSGEVVSYIQNKGISLYGTDVHGTIIVTTDGNAYNIQTKEDGTISPKSNGSTNNSTENENTKTENNTTNATGECININKASAEILQEIIHIGPARARDLIDMRPYKTVDNLTSIDGIGPARIADIKRQGLACTGG